MKRKIILTIIGILILTLSVLGLTYAFMKPQVEEKEEKSNITINACVKIQLKDNSSSINLKNTYPMADDMGLETKAYEFTITSTCDDYVGFNLYLTSLTDNEIEDNNIHFAITSKEGTVLVSDVLSKATNALTEFNTDELKELDLSIKGTHKNIYKVYSENLALKGESNYKLYLWLDKDASNETMGKSFKAGLSVKSYNREETMAEYLIKNKNETLIYHDGSIKDNDGNIMDANDYSYRYAGASEDVKNFVCLDGGEATEGECANNDTDLYRIIGLFKNDLNLYELKLIKYDYATSEQLGTSRAYGDIYNLETENYLGNQDNLENIAGYYWTSSDNNINEWINSELRANNLNEYYLNTYLKTNKGLDIDKLITNHGWELTGADDNLIPPKKLFEYEMKIKEKSQKYPSSIKKLSNKIGLMYASDYGYAASLDSTNNWSTYLAWKIKNNWMYMGLFEWTISRFYWFRDSAFNIHISGYMTSSYPINTTAIAVRPCFYLSSDVKIASGEGTHEMPYRISLN